MFTYWLARFRYVVLFFSEKENTRYMFSKNLLQLLTEPSKKEHNDQFIPHPQLAPRWYYNCIDCHKQSFKPNLENIRVFKMLKEVSFYE